MKKILIILVLLVTGCSFPDSYYPQTPRQSEELSDTFKDMRREQRMNEMEMRIDKLEQGFNDF